jgi:tetratricopeptide (TPR) repeat protein
MTERVTETEPLANRIAVLLDELDLAIKWDRPCITIAVYQSQFLLENLQSIIKKNLDSRGQEILIYKVDKKHNDVALDLRDRPERRKTVFFISGLKQGGGRSRSYAFHALNLHREYLVEEKIRSVFWLTGQEAKLLPRYAPDFWAFRSNVIEFLDLLTVGRNIHGHTFIEKNERSIQSILLQLKDDPRNVVLLKRVANSYKNLGIYEEALVHYLKALRIEPEEKDILLEVADLYIQLDLMDNAKRTIKKLSGLVGNDAGTQKKLEKLNRSVHLLSTRHRSGGILSWEEQTV